MSNIAERRRRFLVRLAGGSEPFILTAMASLIVGSIWMFRERELLLGHYYRPEFLSITHTITLGWISMLMMGVLARLSPRALGVPARSRRWLLAQFVCAFIGYTGMVFHFWVSGWIAMASAAILMVVAASIQIYNFRGIFLRLRGADWLPRYVAASLVHFLLAAILGVLLGFNKVYEIIGGEFFSNIYAHAHLAAIGWVTMMIIGFEHRLLPPSRPEPSPKIPWPSVRFWLLEIGILGLVASFVFVRPWLPVFAVMIALAFFLHAARPLSMLVQGKIQDRASLWATLALLYLLAAGVLGILLSLDIPASGTELRMHVQLAYGYSGLLGWITLTITAQVYKLFPMFVWEERFRDLWGKEPVPAMRDLYSSSLQMLSNSLIAIGVLGASIGIVCEYLPAITFFHGMVIMGVVAFLINFFLMARWALLRKEFKPSQADWERFYDNFPQKEFTAKAPRTQKTTSVFSISL